jgi:hypothetical protein
LLAISRLLAVVLVARPVETRDDDSTNGDIYIVPRGLHESSSEDLRIAGITVVSMNVANHHRDAARAMIPDGRSRAAFGP